MSGLSAEGRNWCLPAAARFGGFTVFRVWRSAWSGRTIGVVRSGGKYVVRLPSEDISRICANRLRRALDLATLHKGQPSARTMAKSSSRDRSQASSFSAFGTFASFGRTEAGLSGSLEEVSQGACHQFGVAPDLLVPRC